MPWNKLNPHLNRLKIAAEKNDVEIIRSELSELVKGFRPDERIVDWVYYLVLDMPHSLKIGWRFINT